MVLNSAVSLESTCADVLPVMSKISSSILNTSFLDRIVSFKGLALVSFRLIESLPFDDTMYHLVVAIVTCQLGVLSLITVLASEAT
jgi:hypothetical protein